MPMRTLAAFAIAALLGIVAVITAQAWLGVQRNAAAQAVGIAGTVPVVVASQPIARGATLDTVMLKVVRFPQGSAPAGAIGSVAEATAGQRLAVRSIEPNEPVLSSKITQPGGKASMSAAMTPGMRAVTLRSNDVAGVAGFVLPGDRVDVLMTRDRGGAVNATTNNTVTQVVADNLKVLGVDQVDDEAASKPVVVKAITLEVTPEQAQTISLAQAVGVVSLSLRQIGDAQALDKRTITIADLGGVRLPAAPVRVIRPRQVARPLPPPAPVGPTINVTRGIVTTDYSVTQ